jgi:hypothetical protein
MHGSFSRGDTLNIMAAIGPDFKSGYVDALPVSNADVGATAAKLLGLTQKAKGKLIGRVMTEAMPNGATPQAFSGTVTSKPLANGLYFDAAGFPGRTLGLEVANPIGSGKQRHCGELVFLTRASAVGAAAQGISTTAASQAGSPAAPAVADTLASLKKEIDLRAAELAQKKTQYEALLKRASGPNSKGKTAAVSNAEPWKGMFQRYQKQYVREGHYDWETVEKVKPAKSDPCNPQRLFVRAYSLDNYLYGITPQQGQGSFGKLLERPGSGNAEHWT